MKTMSYEDFKIEHIKQPVEEIERLTDILIKLSQEAKQSESMCKTELIIAMNTINKTLKGLCTPMLIANAVKYK